MIKAMIHASRSMGLSDVPVTPTTRRVPREPKLVIAPMLARGEGEAAADAAEFTNGCETMLDEAEALRGLPLGD